MARAAAKEAMVRVVAEPVATARAVVVRDWEVRARAEVARVLAEVARVLAAMRVAERVAGWGSRSR